MLGRPCVTQILVSMNTWANTLGKTEGEGTQSTFFTQDFGVKSEQHYTRKSSSNCEVLHGYRARGNSRASAWSIEELWPLHRGWSRDFNLARTSSGAIDARKRCPSNISWWGSRNPCSKITAACSSEQGVIGL